MSIQVMVGETEITVHVGIVDATIDARGDTEPETNGQANRDDRDEGHDQCDGDDDDTFDGSTAVESPNHFVVKFLHNVRQRENKSKPE